MRNRKHSAPFKAILEQVEAGNCERIMERARLANRLAKSVEGSSRYRAYAVKHRALKALALGFPHRVYVSRDQMRPHLLIVGSLTRAWGLHAPDQVFEDHRPSDLAA